MKRRVAFLSLLTAAMLLGACGAASPSFRSAEILQGNSGGAPGAPEMAVDSAMVAPGEAGKSVYSGEPVSRERLVIRNANLTLVVENPTASVETISRMAQDMGGFVVSSYLYETALGAGDLTTTQGTLTIRVPAERLDEALQAIKAGAIEVRSENISGEDVTQQYVDLQSRLRNLEAAEAQLQEIMGSATRTEDVMMVYNQLVQVRGEIESVKGQMQYFEQSAKLSAVTLELIPDAAAQPLQIAGWRPQGTAKAAVEALIQALQFLADAAIWAVICIVPIGVILGLPAYFVVRAMRRRRKAAKAPPAAA
ncbi:MAG: DUF4349 domain-containing protein [Anaerolineales bacterium]|nr:DUF4349 domain-containing protein [Anaerolineales bacterium]